MSVEVKLSLPLDSCPVCSIPLDFCGCLSFARDLQMHAFTADITDECCKNIKVGAGVICFDRLFQVRLCQQLAQQIKKKKKQDEVQILIFICLFWSFSLFLLFSLVRLLEHSLTVSSFNWPCSCHLCVPCHHRESIETISCVAARRFLLYI